MDWFKTRVSYCPRCPINIAHLKSSQKWPIDLTSFDKVKSKSLIQFEPIYYRDILYYLEPPSHFIQTQFFFNFLFISISKRNKNLGYRTVSFDSGTSSRKMLKIFGRKSKNCLVSLTPWQQFIGFIYINDKAISFYLVDKFIEKRTRTEAD